MGPVRAKDSGCVGVAGIDVVFKKGQSVTELAEEVSPEALSFMLSDKGPWEDVSEAIRVEKAEMAKTMGAINAAKAKVNSAQTEAKEAKVRAAKAAASKAEERAEKMVAAADKARATATRTKKKADETAAADAEAKAEEALEVATELGLLAREAGVA